MNQARELKKIADALEGKKADLIEDDEKLERDEDGDVIDRTWHWTNEGDADFYYDIKEDIAHELAKFGLNLLINTSDSGGFYWKISKR